MVQGLAELERRFRQIPDEVRAEVAQRMERLADRIVAEMRARAPKRTGALARSINWTWGSAPKGAMTLGSVGGGGRRPDARYGAMRITIYAGGTPETLRKQRRSSGTRASDKKRSGTFDANNALYQEFGTSRMAANPFFFPVWRARRRDVSGAVRAGVKAGLSKAR